MWSQIGGLVLHLKYNDIVASVVQNCRVVIKHLKTPLVLVTNLITFSTTLIDLAYLFLKLIVNPLFFLTVCNDITKHPNEIIGF